MAREKLKKKVRQKNKKLHYDQVRMHRVLDALGVTELHKTLYVKFRESILNNLSPPLSLEDLGGVASEGIIKRLREWNDICYKGISGSDFAEVMFPLVRYMNWAVGCELMADRGKVSKDLFLRYYVPAEDFMIYFMGRLTELLQMVEWEGTAPDRHYINAEFAVDCTQPTRPRLKIIVRIEPIERIWIWGGWKYRVGTHHKTFFTSSPEMRWLSKNPLDYGLPGKEGENLPVYISDHALERIRDRLDDKWVSIIALFSTYFTLDNPGYYPLNDGSGDTLVELRVKEPDMKFGYFVVSRTRAEIFIRTFLFITMRQTPEGGRLHKRLRMAKPDYAFHELDKYSTLASSDITTHPKLRPIWEECGFGGLLTLIDHGFKFFGLEPKKQAEDLIRYFRLDGK